jgi:hypothetical protein
MRRPAVSVVVVVFDMPREAPRTLHTLSAAYQAGIAADDYEVIVVENGSRRPLRDELLGALPGNVRYLPLSTTSPSPVGAIAHGVAHCRGDLLGIMIDGARMASPGLLARAVEAARLANDPVITSLGWHLGPDVQHRSQAAGYDQAAEDALLASVDWETDGYELFRIACLSESSAAGWFLPAAESNAIFLRRTTWEALGGFDARFDLAGGGFANLDFHRRACEHPAATPIVLLGEGTFHQLHGGVATNRRDDGPLAAFAAQYEQLRGEPFRPPARPFRCYGIVPDVCAPALEQSAVRFAARAVHEPIPVVVCIDVEPDGRHIMRSGRPPWTGYEHLVETMDELRPALSRITRRPARFAWFHRMDPSVADGYGDAAWSVRHYGGLVDRVQRAGDEIGLHVHPARWLDGDQAWLVDQADPAWLARCVDTGVRAFASAMGRPCTAFRFGDRYLDDALVRQLVALGVRVDLTIEPGLPPMPFGNLDDRRAGSMPDYRGTPRVAFRPSAADFRQPGDDVGGSLWMLPLSSGALGGDAPPTTAPWHRAVLDDGPRSVPYMRLALWETPAVFAAIVEQNLAERARPYLTPIVRSDMAVGPHRATVRANLDYLRRHPLASRFAFVGPTDALAMLTGETVAPTSDVARLESELETARAALDAVTSSRSWRYTALLRRLRGALGSLVTRARGAVAARSR